MLQGRGIDWNYDISKDIVRRANEENKLIFLHIGSISNIYSREIAIDLFSNREVCDYINKNYISVIVDKDDKPEAFLLGLDILMMNRDFSYGPMNLFLLPSRRPLVCFSDCEPSFFLDIATNLVSANKTKKSLLIKLSDELSNSLNLSGTVDNPIKETIIKEDILHEYYSRIHQFTINESFLSKLKPYTLNPILSTYLLEYLIDNPNKQLTDSLNDHLDHLQWTPSFDPINGGFFRQASDFTCEHPLFEKTLNENTSFLYLYSLAYKHFGDFTYRDTSNLIFDFLSQEMVNKEGGLMNSITLLTPLEESYFYHFSINELSILFPENYREIADSIGMNPDYNRLDKQLPSRRHETLYLLSKSDIEKLRTRRAEHRGYLKDERVTTAYQASAITDIIKSATILESDKMLSFAKRSLDYLINNHISDNGLIYRYNHKTDKTPSPYLSDYAFFSQSLIYLYRADGNHKHFEMALNFANTIIDLFYKPQNGMFSKTSKDEGLIPIQRESNIDFIRPSANSITASLFMDIYQETGLEKYLQIAEQQIKNVIPSILDSGPMLASWSNQIQHYLSIKRQSKKDR